MKTSLDEFLKNKLPKPLDEFSMFSGKFAKELMEQYASLREKETAIEFMMWREYHSSMLLGNLKINIEEYYTEYTKHKEG